MKKNLLKTTIARKIERRTLRMGLNARQIIQQDLIDISPPDYGLGVIPKLPAIVAANEKALEVIEECSISITKLVLICDFVDLISSQVVISLLNDNKFDYLSLKQLEQLLTTTALKENAKSCITILPERA